MATSSGSCQHNTYDIVASYVRTCGVEWSLSVDDSALTHFTEILPVEDRNYDGSEIIKEMVDFAIVINRRISNRIEAVEDQWTPDVKLMVDLRPGITRKRVQQSFFEMMNGWLLADGHYMCWERIVSMLDFTGEQVFHVASIPGDCGARITRMQDLVQIAAKFIDCFVADWISKNGGWEAITFLKEILLFQHTIDVGKFAPHGRDPPPPSYAVGNILDQSYAFTDEETREMECKLKGLGKPADQERQKEMAQHHFYSFTDEESGLTPRAEACYSEDESGTSTGTRPKTSGSRLRSESAATTPTPMLERDPAYRVNPSTRDKHPALFDSEDDLCERVATQARITAKIAEEEPVPDYTGADEEELDEPFSSSPKKPFRSSSPKK